MHNDFAARLRVRFPRAVVMGITGNWAFAAGTVLLALRRHNPALNADIIVFCDGQLPAEDARILQELGAQLVPFTPVDAELTEEALRVFSPLSLAKFHCFDLLRHYESVVWLDSDILVQDSLEALGGRLHASYFEDLCCHANPSSTAASWAPCARLQRIRCPTRNRILLPGRLPVRP